MCVPASPELGICTFVPYVFSQAGPDGLAGDAGLLHLPHPSPIDGGEPPGAGEGTGLFLFQSQFVGGLVGIALTLGVAKLSWIFFEKPLLRRAHAHRY